MRVGLEWVANQVSHDHRGDGVGVKTKPGTALQQVLTFAEKPGFIQQFEGIQEQAERPNCLRSQIVTLETKVTLRLLWPRFSRP